MTKEQTQTAPLSAKKQRQRQFLLFVPILVLPFLTFLLWTVGFVGPEKAKGQKLSKVTKGLNMDLPDPQLKDNSMNKLSFYEQADKDSAKYKAALRTDPFYKNSLSALSGDDTVGRRSYSGRYDPAPPSFVTHKEGNEQKVYEKLAALNNVLNQPPASKPSSNSDVSQVKTNNAEINSSDVDRLENMLKVMNQKGDTNDPEMDGLNRAMENILDIQHPERVKEKLRKESLAHKADVFPVVLNSEDNISLLQAHGDADSTAIADSINVPQQKKHNAFYTLGTSGMDNNIQSAIEAVVHETQTLVSGATVKLRLMQDIFIGGVLVPKDNFIFGIAQLSGERLTITLNTIRYQNNILPVSLSVYDLDGMEGIYIPGAISRDVTKQSGGEAVEGMQITTMDPSIGAQAATAGIQAAKTLLSKKVKLVRVLVKGGYQVLLRDRNSQNK